MADSASLAPLSFWRSPAVRRVLAGGVLLAGGLALEQLGFGHAWVVPLYLASMLLSGADWVRHGWEELVHCREVGIEALMAAAAIGAAALGLWDEAAALVFLYGLAESVEHLTYDRAKRAIERLLDLVPARRASSGTEPRSSSRPHASSAGIGFASVPASRFPTDGVVEEGASAVDESSLTGEPIPIEKKPGERLFAGTLNRTGSLVFRATADRGRELREPPREARRDGPEVQGPRASSSSSASRTSTLPSSSAPPCSFSSCPVATGGELLRVGAVRRRPPRRGGSLRPRDVHARRLRGRHVGGRSPRHPDQGRPVPRGPRAGSGPSRSTRRGR